MVAEKKRNFKADTNKQDNNLKEELLSIDRVTRVTAG